MPNFITSVPGIGASTAAVLSKHGFRTLEDLAASDSAALSVVPGFGEKRAETVIEAARALLDSDRPDADSGQKGMSEPERVAAVEDTSRDDSVVAEKAKGKKKKKEKTKQKKGKEKKAKKGGKDKKNAKPAKKKGGKGKKAK